MQKALLIWAIVLGLNIIAYYHYCTYNKYNINSGGCGLYALHLKKSMPDAKIVNFYDFSNQRRHFMLYDGEYYYDCNGKNKYPVWLVFKQRYVSVNYLQSIAYDSNWNKTFKLSDTLNF
jgi:hypothetical protein